LDVFPVFLYLTRNVSEWKSWYRLWDKGFSAGMTLIGAAVIACAVLEWPLGLATKALFSVAAVAWAIGGLATLYRSVSHHTTADRITLLRVGFGSAAVMLLVGAELASRAGISLSAYRVPFTLMLLAAAVSDFLDGRVARKVEPTPFGADWDMQNDAAFAMLLSVVAVAFVGVQPWVILIGLARYLFVLMVPGAHEDVETPRSYERFGKVVCAVVVLTLVAVVANGDGGIGASVALALSLGALVSSFGWFTLLLRRERAYVATHADGSRRPFPVE
jgi:phosphatidylglycerophosphate synthase